MPHIVWDWNGTLFDDLPIVVAAVNQCLESQGASPIDQDGYRRHFRRPLHGFYEHLLDRPVDDQLLADLDATFQRAYWEHFDEAALNKDAVAALDRAAVGGATQSIMSMLWHDMLVPTVRGFGLDGYMLALDGNRGAAGDTKQTHMRHHVEHLCELHPGLDPASMTAVGDVLDDAAAARAAGIGCVLFDGGSQQRADLEGAGVPVVASLLEGVEIALEAAFS